MSIKSSTYEDNSYPWKCCFGVIIIITAIILIFNLPPDIHSCKDFKAPTGYSHASWWTPEENYNTFHRSSKMDIIFHRFDSLENLSEFSKSFITNDSSYPYTVYKTEYGYMGFDDYVYDPSSIHPYTLWLIEFVKINDYYYLIILSEYYNDYEKLYGEYDLDEFNDINNLKDHIIQI